VNCIDVIFRAVPFPEGLSRGGELLSQRCGGKRVCTEPPRASRDASLYARRILSMVMSITSKFF